jgi:8-oxo-dGTP pyrophosphatase MutT (NUDIX family)
VSSAPRPSSTMCVLVEETAGIEVLMVRRDPGARFMGGSWVFPGGVVDPGDHEPSALALLDGPDNPDDASWLAAAFREVVEETGIWLTDSPYTRRVDGQDVFAVAAEDGVRFAAHSTTYFANWVTPSVVPVRFDARFFIAELATKVTPLPDEREVDAAEFVAPQEALRRAHSGEWSVPFPTQRTLEQLGEFPSIAVALRTWRRRDVVTIQPRMRVTADGALEVVMPGDPGFDELADAPPNADALAKAVRVAAAEGKPIPEVTGDAD